MPDIMMYDSEVWFIDEETIRTLNRAIASMMSVMTRKASHLEV